MANGSLLYSLRKERPNCPLDETTDEDVVKVNYLFPSPDAVCFSLTVTHLTLSPPYNQLPIRVMHPACVARYVRLR